MKNIILFLTFLFLFVSCTNDDQTVSISSGTSFGMCVGYCIRVLEITSTGASYTASSWAPDSAFAKIQKEYDLQPGEWQTIMSLADMDSMQDYPDVIGCPDCADGGAEWIALKENGITKKITFEYGDSLESIQPIIDEMRVLRARYEARIFEK
jgi:hypothetical protein